MKLRTHLLLLGVAALCVGAPRWAGAWLTALEGSTSGSAVGLAVAVDGSGDVFSAGRLTNGGTLSSLSVVKLAGDTGTELWRRSIDGTATSSSERADDLVIDASGDVIAVGIVDNLLTYSAFAVVKLAGSDGSLLWAEMLEGTRVSSSGDHALAIAVDAAGNVIAAGDLYNDGTRADFAVVKLDASSGAELWRRNLDGSGPAPLRRRHRHGQPGQRWPDLLPGGAAIHRSGRKLREFGHLRRRERRRGGRPPGRGRVSSVPRRPERESPLAGRCEAVYGDRKRASLR